MLKHSPLKGDFINTILVLYFIIVLVSVILLVFRKFYLHNINKNVTSKRLTYNIRSVTELWSSMTLLSKMGVPWVADQPCQSTLRFTSPNFDDTLTVIRFLSETTLLIHNFLQTSSSKRTVCLFPSPLLGRQSSLSYVVPSLPISSDIDYHTFPLLRPVPR